MVLAVALAATMAPAQTRQGPLRIEITEGVIEPLPFAVSPFVAENPAAEPFAQQISQVIAQNLSGTGLFRQIGPDAFISRITQFDSPISFPDWKAINAQALVTGAVSVASDGRLIVKFRLFDVFAEAPLGEGLQFFGAQNDWRRMAHRVSDQVYSRITGETGYFDSRVVFVSESGPKDNRRKRLAIMDYDGANLQFLTDASTLVLAPRFSPTGDRVLYTSYETGFPQIFELSVGNVSRRQLPVPAETMTFAPRYAPDGRTVVFSLAQGGNTDIYRLDLSTGQRVRLTSAPSIETAPSFSPDGRQIVFESDRSGTPQLYVMSAGGGAPPRISCGPGR
jgi:TolB protein